jgi:hypothetical protein
MAWWTPAGVAFVVAGVLEVMFLFLSVLGTILGGALTVTSIAGSLPPEDAFVAVLVFLFYGVWFLATVVAGPVHVVAGVAILVGRRYRPLVWVATALSLLPLATMYCAPTAMIAGALGLVALIVTAPGRHPPDSAVAG